MIPRAGEPDAQLAGRHQEPLDRGHTGVEPHGVALPVPPELHGCSGRSRRDVDRDRGSGEVFIERRVVRPPEERLSCQAVRTSEPAVLDQSFDAWNRHVLDPATVGGIAGPTNSFDVLRWPGVVREADRDAAPLVAESLSLLEQTADDLNEARIREGARIHEMISARCHALTEQVATVRARLPEVTARIRDKVLERVNQLGAQVEPERLEQEIALLAYKMDVEEELDRLGSHVTETLRILDLDEPAGRRLDFLMQEMNREANTLSSKSQDVETTRAAVEMKVLIEQMREQVQNVE